MLLSFAWILLFGMIGGKLFKKSGLPSLLGMLLSGILIGPYCFNMLDQTVLNISADLRKIALIIILARAGLNLDFDDLRAAGRPALLLCFVPACFEIIGTICLAPRLLGMNYLEAAILGTVLAAVSPAVIVPRMLQLMEHGYGNNLHIPQMIMTGASADDVFVIVLFSAFTKLAQHGSITPAYFLNIPTSIGFGILAGIAVGIMLEWSFSHIQIRDSIQVCLILAVSFILVSLENLFTGNFGFSGLLAIMAMGCIIKRKNQPRSVALSRRFSDLWNGAEILLFVLVGASVNIRYALLAGFPAVLLILGILVFRSLGVLLSVSNTALNRKEKTFAVIAYLPKATVQAAIGGLPLAMGLACGETVLAVAVMAIIITAPLGAILIDMSYAKLLFKTSTQHENPA